MAVTVDLTTTCVRVLLCGLSSAAQTALRALVESQRAVVNAQLVAAEAKLIALAPEVAGLEAARALVAEAVSVTTDVAGLVPVSLIAGCVQLGDFTQSLVAISGALSSEANLALLVFDDLTRALALRDELSQLITQLNTVLDGFTLILNTLDLCGGQA